MPGDIEECLKSEKRRRGTLVFVLIDSEISDPEASSKLAVEAQRAGSSAILVGGSSATDQLDMSKSVKRIKESVDIPAILFPGNITGVVPGADAILFSSLLNSENPYYISQAQVLGAPNVLRYGLEPLPTAYLIIGQNTTAWFVGSARGIPFEKPKIAAAYALAARFLGMRFVYLEAGSGSTASVGPEMVGMVRRVFDGFLIVGGGIRDPGTAKALSDAGADALVIGTLVEGGDNLGTLEEIIKTIQRGDRVRE